MGLWGPLVDHLESLAALGLHACQRLERCVGHPFKTNSPDRSWASTLSAIGMEFTE